MEFSLHALFQKVDWNLTSRNIIFDPEVLSTFKFSQALSKLLPTLNSHYKNSIEVHFSVTMSDHNDYRENITYETTVAQKNFVKREEFDLQQLATEVALKSAERKIKILSVVCLICLLTIAICLVSIFVIIGNGSNLGPVSPHSTQCLSRENEILDVRETPVSFEEQIIAGRYNMFL